MEQHRQFEVEVVADSKAVDIVEEAAVGKVAVDNSLEIVHLVEEENNIVVDFEGSLCFVDPLLFVRNMEEERRGSYIKN